MKYWLFGFSRDVIMINIKIFVHLGDLWQNIGKIRPTSSDKAYLVELINYISAWNEMQAD